MLSNKGWQWFIGKNPSFAAGFEVEPRENGEPGLETTIDMMSTMIGSNLLRLTDFDGTSVLKGDWEKFVLVDTNTGSAIWKYVVNIEGYLVPDVTGHTKNALIESGSLSHRRHFILSGFELL